MVISSRLYLYRVKLKRFTYAYSSVCRPASRRSDLLFYCSFEFIADLSRLRSCFPTGHDQASIDADYNLDAGLYVPTSTSKIHIIRRNMTLFTVTYRTFRYFDNSHIGLHWVFLAIGGFCDFDNYIIDDAKCIVVTRVCVSVHGTHAYAIARIRM